MKRVLALSLLVAATAGCQKYIAVPHSAADRMWIITADGTEVFRCWDLKNQLRHPAALCRRAAMLGKDEQTPLSDAAESSAPPAHMDSTEKFGTGTAGQ